MEVQALTNYMAVCGNCRRFGCSDKNELEIDGDDEQSEEFNEDANKFECMFGI